MRKKQSQIIKILFLLITAASLPSSSKQAISTKTTCTKPHCTVCKLDESCITCESGWSAQGSPDCFKCAEGCLSCSGPKASSCNGSCESGWKHKPGEGCVKKGGANAVTIIVIIIIIVFLCMVAYVCYKSFKGKKGDNRVRNSNQTNWGNKQGSGIVNVGGGGMKIQNHALGQGNQAYQGIKANRPNNMDFVKEVEKEKINNLNFVKEVEKNKNQSYAKGIEDNDETKKKKNEEAMKELERMRNNEAAKDLLFDDKPKGVKCVNGICAFDDSDQNQANLSTSGGSSPEYLGNEFLQGDSKATALNLRRAEFVAIYFSASWCGPCRNFTDKLIKQYEKMNSNGKKLEIVLVTHDNNETTFKEYYKKMPWLALPFGNPNIQNTKSKFTIKGIPKFVVTCNGKVIDEDGWKLFGYGDGNPDTIYKSLVELKEDVVEHKWDHLKPSKNYPFLEKYLLKGKNREAASSLDKPEFVGFYMSASWCGPCRNFTPKLKEFYEKLKNREQKLEIVFCTNDRNENDFQEYYAKMPWLAVPMNNSKALHESWQAYPANGIPKLTIVNNKTMKVVTEGGVADITRNLSDPEKLIKEWKGENIENKPNPVVKNEEEKNNSESGLGYLGNHFIDNKGGKYNINDLKKPNVLALYFSASWCPPCRNFTSKLIPFYEDVNKNGKKFEIVLVRSDQDEAKFNEYFGKMPWRALPFNSNTEINEAKKKFSVRGIPFMAVLNGNGDVVSKNAVAEIMYCKDNEALIKKYRGE